jgi:hypothetical protein
MTWRSRFPGGFCKLRGSGCFLRRGRSTPRPSGVPLIIEARISLPRLRIAANATPPAICSALCDRACGWRGPRMGRTDTWSPISRRTRAPGSANGKRRTLSSPLRTGTPEQGKVKGRDAGDAPGWPPISERFRPRRNRQLSLRPAPDRPRGSPEALAGSGERANHCRLTQPPWRAELSRGGRRYNEGGHPQHPPTSV